MALALKYIKSHYYFYHYHVFTHHNKTTYLNTELMVKEQHSKFDLQTYQKAHEVKRKDSRNSTKRQALEHSAANSGGVTKFPGGIGWLHRRAALRFRASLCSPDSHYQYQDWVHYCSMFTACKEERVKKITKLTDKLKLSTRCHHFILA